MRPTTILSEITLNSTANALDYPRGDRVTWSVVEALVKVFGDSLNVQARIDIDAILLAVTATISRQVPVTCIAILMKGDPGTSRVVTADQVNPEVASYIDDYVASLFRPGEAPTSGLSQRVIEAGRPVFKPDMTFDEFLPLISAEGQTYFSRHPFPIGSESVELVMVPMRSGPAIVGTLALFDWQKRADLTEADIEWMQTVGDRVGLTVDSAQQRNRAIDRIERLVALSDVTLAITSSQDLRVTLKLILERVIATLCVDAADVLLIDEDDQAFYVAANSGFRSSLNPDIRFPIPTDTDRQALFERKVGTPTATEWMGQHRRWLMAREGLKTYIAAPLVLREKVVGALEVFCRTRLEADPEWLSFLDAVAYHAAIGVDNATMFGALQRARHTNPPRKLPVPILSDREREILALVVDGASNREVAEKLHLSQNTIKFHIRQLLEKAVVSNRTELATKAVQQDWL